MCRDTAERERAKEILLPVVRTLENLIRAIPLCVVYLYRQSDQPSALKADGEMHMQDIDGIEWVDVTPDRGNLHAIGLSVEALDKGRECFQMLFCHELAHIFCGVEHGLEFHAVLDHLITQCNSDTGATIVNDYYGLKEAL